MKETGKKYINPSYEMLQARYYIDNLESKYANNQNKINLSIVHWKEFEELVAALFTLELECKVTPTRGSNDHGIDAIAIKKTETGFEEIIFQMKRYKGYVGPHVVRDLLGTMVNNKATAGVLVTTGSFGPSIYEFVQNKRIYLYNGPRLLLLLRKHGYSNFYIDSKKSSKTIVKSNNINLKKKTLSKQTRVLHKPNNTPERLLKEMMELQLRAKDLSENITTFRKEIENKAIELNNREIENKRIKLEDVKTEKQVLELENDKKENKLDTSCSMNDNKKLAPTQLPVKNCNNNLQSNKHISKKKKIYPLLKFFIIYIICSFINIKLGVFYLIIVLLYIIYKKIYKRKH